jgi:hypothetical protein
MSERHVLAILSLAFGCSSCLAQGLYTTPRTLGDDRRGWIAAPQVELTTLKNPPPRCEARELEKSDAGDPNACSPFGPRWWPTPQFAHRVGIGERLEAGIFFPAGLGGDLKWHALHAGPFDLALMPRLSLAFFTLRRNVPPTQYYGFTDMVFQAPVLASLTAGPLAFVMSPGPVEVFDFDGGVTHGVRFGFGIQWKLLEHFALHPEASIVEEYAGPAELNAVVVGLGILWKDLAWRD